MNKVVSLVVAVIFFGIFAASSTAVPDSFSGPSKVEVKKDGAFWVLTRNGSPYYIKGAGGQMKMDMVVKAGGNSIRTWGTNNAQKILDEAQSNGLTVCMGLWVQHERHGFDYDNQKKVQEQLEGFRKFVRAFKDHPALLCWGIGNECNLQSKNKKVWNAINDISKMIHKEDGNHPTMTVTAAYGQDLIDLLNERCADLDMLGVNAYASLDGLPRSMRTMGWARPYLATEWGINGMWESGKTSWGAFIEPPSGKKGPIYLNRYKNVIAEYADKSMVGSYVFQWGWKQEKTATWFGLFCPPGVKTELYDFMQKAWTGEWPKDHCPHVTALVLNDKDPSEDVKIKAGSKNSFKVTVTDVAGLPMDYQWHVFEESTSRKSGGDREEAPPEIDGLFTGSPSAEMNFTAPSKPGAYRAYIYVYDKNGAGTANFPFFVE